MVVKFARLLHIAKSGWWLPFAGTANQRSFLALDNVTDFLQCCLTHPGAPNEVFLISDDEVLSTGELMIKIRRIMGKPPRLFYFPEPVLVLLFTLMGKKNFLLKIIASLKINSKKAKTLLNWQPKVTLEQGLADVVAWYEEQTNKGGQ